MEATAVGLEMGKVMSIHDFLRRERRYVEIYGDRWQADRRERQLRPFIVQLSDLVAHGLAGEVFEHKQNSDRATEA